MDENFSESFSAKPGNRDWRFVDPIRQSQDLWTEFKACFAKAVIAQAGEHLNWLTWNNRSQRTAFYATAVLPEVARLLGLVRETELFRVDTMLGKGVTREEYVPIIHIEYENEATSAHQEVRKLCALGGQLKVLITCAPWDRAVWSSTNIRCAEDYLAEWRGRVKLQQAMYPNDCTYGVIVGERVGKTLTYYETTLSEPFADESAKGNVLLKGLPLC
jgi:hypothetical protein